MIRFFAQFLLTLFLVRVLFATVRFLLGSGPSARPLNPPGPEPPLGPPSPRRNPGIDRENAIDVPFTEIPGPQP
jgi:hypothetical protein